MAEFQRASQLQTAAAQQQAIMAQTQGQSQQNEQQALVLKDEQMRRQYAPDFVQKDANGKVTGFDNEGLYNKLLQNGADPQNINKMRMSNIETQKAILGMSSAQRDYLDKMHGDFQDALETVQGVYNKESKPVGSPAAPPPAAGVASAPSPTLQPAAFVRPSREDAGIPATSQSQTPPIGTAPAGTPESLGSPAPGTAPTSTESSVQNAMTAAPRPVGPLTQQAYQAQLMKLAQIYGPQAVGRLQPMLHDARDIEQAEAEIGSIKEAQNNADKLADIAKKSGEGAKGQAEAQSALWKPAGEGTLVNIQTGQMIHGVAPPDVEAFKSFVAKGGDPIQYPAFKAQQEAAAKQPYAIQTAEAEGKARQLIQGMGESVYAFKPDGTHELMNKTAALQAQASGGVKAMVPATEKQIGDDIMLNNRLSDVQQKINNYDQTLGKLGTTITDKDQGNIAAIMGKQSFKVGAFGTEVPVDRLNAALDKENIKGLSDDAIKALAAYYNARESLVGYNRVLSGSARGGEKQMELSQDTLPNLATTDPRLAKEGINQFRQNLQIVGQGLPVIPGIKRPNEWSPNPGSAAPGTAPTPAKDWFSTFGGRARSTTSPGSTQ